MIKAGLFLYLFDQFGIQLSNSYVICIISSGFILSENLEITVHVLFLYLYSYRLRSSDKGSLLENAEQ